MSLEYHSLQDHLAQTEGKAVHEQIYYFHAHHTFPPEEVRTARSFRSLIAKTFEGDQRIQVEEHFFENSIGPFADGMFEVIFTRPGYTEFITWLQFNRPNGVNILIHPVTALPDQLVSHTDRSLILGKMARVFPDVLRHLDKNLEKRGGDYKPIDLYYYFGRNQQDFMQAMAKPEE
ncbi:hypothetical protein Unana1_04277 [Umbelopsis nana]